MWPAEPGKAPSGPDLVRLTPLSNVSDRKRVLARHASAKLAPLRRAKAAAFHGRFGALNDFGDWLAVRDRYKNVRVSRHWSVPPSRPDRPLAVRIGAHQLRNVPNRSGLSLDLSPADTGAFRLGAA